MTANAGLFTDYRFRGISQTNKHPAFQGGFDFTHTSGFYLGNWNSNVDAAMYTGANLEMDFYGGFKGSFDAFSYDVGALYYYYPGSGIAGSTKIDNTELYIAGGWGPFTLKYSYAVSDFFSAPDSKGAYYVDGTVAFPVDQGVRADRPHRLPGQPEERRPAHRDRRQRAAQLDHRLEARRHLRPERLGVRCQLHRHRPQVDGSVPPRPKTATSAATPSCCRSSSRSDFHPEEEKP